MTNDPVQITIQSYDETVDAYRARVDHRYPQKRGEKFLNLLPKGGKILDIGCAYGRDSKIFADQGFTVHGIDLSRGMIKEAQKNIPHVLFEVGDMRKLDLDQNSFDGIWANKSLIHVPKSEIAITLQNWNKILKKSGILMVSVKQGEGELLETDNRYGGHHAKFLSLFTEQELAKFLISAGFETIDFEVKPANDYNQHSSLWFLCQKT